MSSYLYYAVVASVLTLIYQCISFGLCKHVGLFQYENFKQNYILFNLDYVELENKIRLFFAVAKVRTGRI